VDNPSKPAERDRLDSWKEIAEYIGRDVRTAIRWEHERGLPVHRVPGGRRGAVFAYASEIDRWRAGLPPNGAGTAFKAPEAGPPSDSTAHASPATVGAEPSPSVPGLAGRGAGRRLVWLGAGLAGAVLLATGAAALRLNGTLTAGRAQQTRLARVEVGSSEIVVRTETGAVAWRHEFEVPLVDLPVDGFSHRYAIADLDGDGGAEVVATVSLSIGPGVLQDELICFSSTGEVRWRIRLDDRVAFRGGTFGPPWMYGFVAVYTAAGQARIAWTQSHQTWWPGILTLLDGSGRRLSTFVQSGQIRELAVVDGPEGSLVLIGGIANAYRAASLAVLDATSVAGHSPAPAGSPYECTSCLEGSPLSYFVFPPSEITAASGQPYNFLVKLRSMGNEIEAMTRESNPGAPVAELIFRFARDSTLLQAQAADSWAAHEAFERAGKLDHSVADCPMYRTPPPVRAWDPVKGWRDLKPRDASVVAEGPRPGNP
jgi:hypothetical protein